MLVFLVVLGLIGIANRTRAKVGIVVARACRWLCAGSGRNKLSALADWVASSASLLGPSRSPGRVIRRLGWEERPTGRPRPEGETNRRPEVRFGGLEGEGANISRISSVAKQKDELRRKTRRGRTA
jgi:hypothetical protein